jgi:hypothetical protein
MVRNVILFSLFVAISASDAAADGRNIKATRACSTEETEKSIATLHRCEGEKEWSKESRKALDTLFECADATFVGEKTIDAADGTSYKIEAYRLDSLGLTLNYSTKSFLGLHDNPKN